MYVHTCMPACTSGNDTRALRGRDYEAMVFHAGRLLCLEEGSKPWEICLPSLETSGRFTFRGRLRHNFTAHPKVCPLTGRTLLEA